MNTNTFMTCLHEAGHILVAREMGVNISRVIVNGEEKGAAMSVLPTDMDAIPPRRRAIAFAAGWAAETIRTPFADSLGSWGDLREIERLGFEEGALDEIFVEAEEILLARRPQLFKLAGTLLAFVEAGRREVGFEELKSTSSERR